MPPRGNRDSQTEAVAAGRPKSLARRHPFTLICMSGQQAAPLLAGHAVLEVQDLRRNTSLLTPARHQTPPTPDQEPPGQARGPKGFQDIPVTGRVGVLARGAWRVG